MRVYFLSLLLMMGLVSISPNLAKAQETTDWARIIKIQENAEVEAKADFANIRVQVRLEDRDRHQLEEDVYKVAREIKGVFRRYFIREDDYETDQSSINDYYWQKDRDPVATISFTVKFKDLSKIDDFRRDVIKVGATNFDVMNFENNDPERYILEATIKAMKKGRRKAEKMAFAEGMKVGYPIRISDTYQVQAPQPVRFEMADARMYKSANGANREPVVQKTTVTYSATVYIDYEMSVD